MTIFNLNGRRVSVHSPVKTPLLWVIRDEMGLSGTKFACGIGMCGACTVHVEGRATRSCITAIGAVAGTKVTTIEGLDPEGRHPVQVAWTELQVSQCGYCQSGQIMQAVTLLKDFPNPTDQDINAVMAGSVPLHDLHSNTQGHQARGLQNARRKRPMNNLSPHGFRSSDDPSRRGFLITMMGAGVMLGYARRSLADQATSSAGDLFEPTIWYGIDRSGTVTVNIIRAELGQHVGTALARIVADELEADWGKVKVALVDTDPKWGLMLTGGSLSVWQSFQILSRAGAAGRVALIDEGAKLLGANPLSCTARNGVVRANGRSIRYGDIVAHGNMRRAFTPEQLHAIPIKAPGERRLIGRDTMALDVPSKTNGTGRYGIDAIVEGMVFARPKIPPTRYDSKVVSIDDSGAKHLPGYIRSLALDDPSGIAPGWVMVFAESFATANQAADLVKVTWKSGDAARVSERDIQNRAAELIVDPKGGAMLVEDAGVERRSPRLGKNWSEPTPPAR